MLLCADADNQDVFHPAEGRPITFESDKYVCETPPSAPWEVGLVLVKDPTRFDELFLFFTLRRLRINPPVLSQYTFSIRHYP